MKVKLLRRVFCVVMCIVILACSSVNALAKDLFARNFHWVTRDIVGDLYIQWINYNIPQSHNTATVHGHLVSGASKWTAKTSINLEQLDSLDWNTTEYIAMSAPAHSYWNLLIGSDPHLYNAVTVIETSDGSRILDRPGASMTSSEIISYADIFFNPFQYSRCSDSFCYCRYGAGIPNSWSTVVAHEIGHAIGFAHSDDPNNYTAQNSYDSIMRNDIANFIYDLKDYDVAEYNRKYGE